MMDHIRDDCVPIQIREIASCENIKEATMKKLHEKPKTTKRPRIASRVLLIAALVVLALSVTVSAATTLRSGRFTIIDNMSDGEVKALIDDASRGTWAVQEIDGTMHYYDSDGNETMVLSREDAQVYERARQAQREQSVKESTTLVDLSTMPLLPNEVTELASEEDGRFPDFAISNGSLVLLHPEGKDAYELKAGDTVTISLDSGDECYLEFGSFKDGAFSGGETVHARQHSYTFTMEEDGQYCFYVEYYSVGMSAFRNCVIAVR